MLYFRKKGFLIIAVALLSGCATNNNVEKYNKHETNGSIAGVSIASLATVASGGTGGVLFVNSIIGGIIGNKIGKYIDEKNEDSLAYEEIYEEKDNNITIEQKIKITFPSDITFGVNSFAINDDFKLTLKEFSVSLLKYTDYKMTIFGHTDNTGTEKYNLDLSLKRASSIKDELVKNGISSDNIVVVGKGESEPTDSNNTDVGRNKNRRVEIKLNITE